MNKLESASEFTFEVLMGIATWLITVYDRYLGWLDKRVDNRLGVVLLSVLPPILFYSAILHFAPHWVIQAAHIVLAVVVSAFLVFFCYMYLCVVGTKRRD